jgi:hypothetical protein
MGVLWLRAKVQLRGRALASLFLALLVGLAGALVLAAAAGARRSEAALPRFLAVNRTVDSWVTVQASDPADDLAKVRRQLAALPEVRQVFRVSGVVGGLILAGADPAAGAHPVRWHYLLGTVALDPGGSVAFGRPILAAGRLPDERRPEEAAVDEELAERYHLRVGSRYRVGAFTLEQFGPATALAAVAPQGGVVDLRVVGIVRYPMDLDPTVTDQDNALVQHGELYLAPLRAQHRQLRVWPGGGPAPWPGGPAPAPGRSRPPVRRPGRRGHPGVGQRRDDHCRDAAGWPRLGFRPPRSAGRGWRWRRAGVAARCRCARRSSLPPPGWPR